MWTPLFLSTTLLLSLSGSTSAKLVTTEVDTFIKNLPTEWHTPSGIGIAVVSRHDDGTWEVETGGYGSSDASGTPVTNQMQFFIGSSSNHFDVIATGLLISNTSLSPAITWDTPMKQIFPDWKLLDSEASEKATITDLMSHRTGVPRHDPALDYSQDQDFLFKTLFPNIKPSAPFRSAWQYNNAMYTALSYIPQQLIKTPLSRFIQSNIFDKLGMNDTTYSTKKALGTGRLAKGVGQDGWGISGDIFGQNATSRDLPTFNPDSGDDGNVVSGPGGIISTAADLTVWLQTLILNGTHPTTNETIVPADVLGKLTTPIMKTDQIFPPNNDTSDVYYGGGRWMYQYRGEDLQEHDGEITGFTSTISMLPNRHVAVAILSNSLENRALVPVIKFRILDSLMGLEPSDWKTSPPPSGAPLPSESFDKLQGTYSNAGYGKIELCYVAPSTSVSSTSDSCKETLSRTNAAFMASTATHKFVVGRPGSPFNSHWILSHFSGDLFNMTDALFEPIQQNSTRVSRRRATDSTTYWPAEIDPFGVAMFDKASGGFGIGGGFWGGGSAQKEPTGSTPQDKAEVWFSKGESAAAAKANDGAALRLPGSWVFSSVAMMAAIVVLL
ncbi:beta-lactamase/transpeptidase-like protein [Flagelloscypha sp. PMI_526]|nr:beta-lactamase/transpeptidase-like protein [Flagelloscypha sp. PMI_526]